MRYLMIGILLVSLATDFAGAGTLYASPERQRETLRGIREVALSFGAGAPEALGLLSNQNVLEALLRNRLRESGITLLEGKVSGREQAVQSAFLHIGILCNNLSPCDSLYARIEVQQYVTLARDNAVSFMSPTFEDDVFSSKKIKSPSEAEA